MQSADTTRPVALITGAAKRVGATLCQALHQAGYNIVIHYNLSSEEATSLADKLNQLRPNSACAIQADLNQMPAIKPLAEKSIKFWGRIDLLINNASSFFPTPVAQSNQDQWEQLINSNLRAPYFLCCALAEELKKRQGSIINLIDIHAQRGLPGHPIYSIAKAGLQMMTMSLAKELAPEVRVNGIAPGAILWPEAGLSESAQQEILDKVLLQRTGCAEDIAKAALYLTEADYVTGQILAVDGGKSLYSH